MFTADDAEEIFDRSDADSEAKSSSVQDLTSLEYYILKAENEILQESLKRKTIFNTASHMRRRLCKKASPTASLSSMDASIHPTKVIWSFFATPSFGVTNLLLRL